jgi:hypothetical protein
MTADERDAIVEQAEYAAERAADDFVAVYELIIRVAQPGDSPLALANDCWDMYCSLREHIRKFHDPPPKNLVN